MQINRPSERAAKMQEGRDERIAIAHAKTDEANARYDAAKKGKKQDNE